jgi:hypothetical protein
MATFTMLPDADAIQTHVLWVSRPCLRAHRRLSRTPGFARTAILGVLLARFDAA